MTERCKTFGYEITTDPTFMDKQNAMTDELRRELEPLYHKIDKEKGSDKIITKLLRLIKKHPRNPQLKNYLTVAYNTRGKTKKAEEANRWILAEHPDYLFGRLNLAAEYIEKKEYEKVPEVLGELMEIKDLYPDREKFHLGEVTGFNRIAIVYYLAIGNLEAAESRLEVMEEIAPDHPDTKDALLRIMTYRMEAGMKRWEDEEKTRIKVKTLSSVEAEQTDQKPEFTHDEIHLLYEKGLYIERETLQKILELPRETLISDLEKVLFDLQARYTYFEEYVEANDWDEETMNFGMHALFLLGQLRAVESLDAVFDTLRQGGEFLTFWFGDFLNEGLWESLYYLLNKQSGKLKAFVTEPGIYTYVRFGMSGLMQQVWIHQPERKDEVIAWYKDVLRYFIGSGLIENVVDSDAIGFIVSDLIEINAVELLPEIEKLYKLGYVSEGVCGSLESVKEDIAKPYTREVKKELLDIFERYEEITSTWAGYTEGNDEEVDFDDDFDDDMSDFDFMNMPNILPKQIEAKKVGRNEPCPCGSGKKYKKCCLGK